MPAADRLRGQRVLITGGAGFLATAIAERLAGDNELVLLDLDFDRGRPVTYSSVLGRETVTTIAGDIRDADVVKKAAEGVDVVVHAAAIVGVHRVIAHARDTIETNLLGTVNLLTAVAEASDLHRFLFFSTSEVFGGSSFRVDEAAFALVGSVDEARWSYSIAKLAGEHLVSAYYREVGLPTVIVRPFNVFGPRRTGDHAVLRFIGAALAGEPLVVHGDGSQVRSWCYVDDFVDGLIATLTEPAAVGKDFNIGNSRNTVTIYDLAQRVKRIAGSSSPVTFEDIAHPDIDIRVPATSKATKLFGYQPTVELDEGLAATVEWYREHPEVFAGLR